MLGQKRPRGALVLEDPGEDVRPGAADRGGVDATGAAAGRLAPARRAAARLQRRGRGDRRAADAASLGRGRRGTALRRPARLRRAPALGLGCGSGSALALAWQRPGDAAAATLAAAAVRRLGRRLRRAARPPAGDGAAGAGAAGGDGGGRRGAGRRRDALDVEATLEAVEARGIPALAGGGREQDARADQLELEARRGGAGHLGEPGVDDVGRAGQGAAAEGGRLLAHPLELVLGHAAQHRRRAVGHGRDDDEVAQPLEQVLDEPARVEPGLDDPVDLVEHARRRRPRRTRR